MSNEHEERLKQIRERSESKKRVVGKFKWARVAVQEWSDIDFLLSLIDSQAAISIADDQPYRIVEEMGLGLTFRSCTCGQLPCARLRPLREALEATGRDAATRMREACVSEILVMKAEHIARGDLPLGRKIFDEITNRVQSLLK